MKIYNTNKTNGVILRITILFFCFLISIFLTACFDVKKDININKDGSGDALIDISIQKEFASLVVPGLKEDIPEGWDIIKEKEEEGKHIIVIGGEFKEISELNDDKTRYTFSSERKGFTKNSYFLEIEHLVSFDMPFPYELTIKMPGNIDETNGTKISSNKVRWSLTGINRGTNLYVKSSANIIPTAIIYIATAIVGVFMILIITKIIKRVKTPVSEISSKSKTVFCTQCGKENSAIASFCINCGQKID